MKLGVDIDVFHPVRTEADAEDRAAMRRDLGFTADDVVCVYSGKLTKTKNALILAEAVARLRGEGRPFRTLIVGDGVQRDQIAGMEGAVVRGFVHYSELGRFYRAADIGVWPTNESTSTLDAAASGLPLVVSDAVGDTTHVDENGFLVRLNDLDHLTSVVARLENRELRHKLGVAGSTMMARDYSWDSVARRRSADYLAYLRRRAPRVARQHQTGEQRGA
jgi:glycosyltransferase involved in cell wall biosynthesis